MQTTLALAAPWMKAAQGAYLGTIVTPALREIGAARFTSGEAFAKFVFAGNATFTIRSGATGTRYTFRVRRFKARGDTPSTNFAVNLLTGPDNGSSYEYIGWVAPGRDFKPAKGVSLEAKSTLAVAWVFQFLARERFDVVEGQTEIWHAGTCGRCGRMLTTPESVDSGLGPDCRAKIEAC